MEIHHKKNKSGDFFGEKEGFLIFCDLNKEQHSKKEILALLDEVFFFLKQFLLISFVFFR